MRKLKKEEYDLIVFMLRNYPDANKIIGSLSHELVEEMDDNGMGSLRFVNVGIKEKKIFGKEIAQLSFIDLDGVPVSFSINVDKEGGLFELDVFKGDFSSLKRFPIPPYEPLPPPDIM